MCGIVGVVTGFVNGFSYDEANMFRDMLVMDTLRGFDSTGCFGVTNRGNMGMVKDAINGAAFVRTKEFEAFNSDLHQHGLFAVGHNRAATRGSITDKNAHPFCVDDKIVLVQNGTYKGDHKHLKNTDVDSEAIAHVIAEDDDIEKSLKRINAAYALVWYNIKDKTLNIIRNDERPMCIAYTKSGGMVYASEREIILAAAMRNNIELKSAPYLIEQGNLITLKITDDRTYEDSYKEVDTKFDYKNLPSFRSQTQHPCSIVPPSVSRYGYEENDWEVEVRNARRLASPQRSWNGPADITKQMHIMISDGKFNKEFGVGHDIADKLLEQFNAKRNVVGYKSMDKTLIQLVDYIPLNDHKQCSTFALIGRRFTVEDEPSALYYFNVWNSSEEDVMKLVLREFCHVVPTSVQRTAADKDYNNLNRQFVTAVYCVNPEPISNPEMEEEQVH